MSRRPIGRNPRCYHGLQTELCLFPRFPTEYGEILDQENGNRQPNWLPMGKVAEQTQQREDRYAIRANLEEI